MLKISFEMKNNILLILASINENAPMTFIVDTGASTSVLTPQAAQQTGVDINTGLEDSLFAVDGNAQSTTLVTVEKFTLGEKTFSEVLFALLDLSSVSQKLGTPVDGVVGLNILCLGILEVDFLQKELFLYQNNTNMNQNDTDKVSSFSIRKEGLIQVPVTLDESDPFQAILDLGAERSFLNWEAASIVGVLRDDSSLKKLEIQAQGAGQGAFSIWERSFQTLSICHQTFSAPSLLLSDLPIFETLLPKNQPLLLLGNDLLSQHKLRVDFLDKTMCFLPPAENG